MSKPCRNCTAAVNKGIYCTRCLQQVTRGQLQQHLSWMEWEISKRTRALPQEVPIGYGKPKFVRKAQKPPFERELVGVKAELNTMLTQLNASGALDGLDTVRLQARIGKLKIKSAPRQAELTGTARCRVCNIPCESLVCGRCKNSCPVCEQLTAQCACQKVTV